MHSNESIWGSGIRPLGVDAKEAGWVTKRLAELLEWEIPIDLG